jgi:dipeptidyl-peptidase-4
MNRYDRITFDDMAEFPRPGMATPQQIRVSPDGRHVTYLLPRAGSSAMDLWAYDVAAHTNRLMVEAPPPQGYSLEEELRRERSRTMWDGFTHYQRHGDTWLFGYQGALWVRRGDGPLTKVEGTDGALDPELLEDGVHVVFVRQRDLELANVETGRIRPITTGAGGTVSHGVAEFVAQEELGRRRGYWASRDGRWIAFEEVDEKDVPVFPITHLGGGDVWLEEVRYPFAGRANAQWRIGVLPLEGGSEPRWLDLEWPEGYIGRVEWSPSGELLVLVLRRDNRAMEWWRVDPTTGAGSLWWREVGDPWVNLPHGLTFLKSGGVVYDSEETGFRHLYRRDPDGHVTPLTAGEFQVTDVNHVDEAAGVLYCTATKDDPRERHVYRVNLAGEVGSMVRLTDEAGMHQAVVSADGQYLVDQVNTLRHATETHLVDLRTGQRHIIHQTVGATAEALGLTPPELVTLVAADGHTPLYGAVYHPQGKKAGEKVPAVVMVYGGTHAQTVTAGWMLTIDLMAQYLAQHGYLVFKLDNRGMYNRGSRFEGSLHRRFATVEVEDQVAGVRWITEHHNVDPDRVGVTGWSYGGYMTLMLLTQAPDVFRAGVAGAPVTDFRGYDTAYTERYMDTPQTNPDGYRHATVMEHVDGLKGRLLIIHGMIDENVHFRHTARLIEALVAADKDFELLALPSSRHSARGRVVQRYRARRTLEFLMRHV